MHWKASPPDTAEYLFAVVLNNFPEMRFSNARQLAAAKRWAQLINRLADPAADKATIRQMSRVGLLRKSGFFDQALAAAGPLERAQNWHEATAIGLVLRQMKRLEEAEQAFVYATQFDTTDTSAYLEAADGWFENAYWEKALHYYEKVLKTNPQQPWAQPSSWFCQWKITGDEQWLNRVVAAAKDAESLVHERATQLWWIAFGGLPEPEDATANCLRQLRQKFSQGSVDGKGEIKIDLSSIEAPSNALAIRLDKEALGLECNISITVQHIPEPDPRIPKEPVEWLLWNYDGTHATAALPPPDPHILQCITQLASTPYDALANWAAAGIAAKELGANKVSDILATMVYPPAVPESSYALQWLPRVQLCTMQVIAQLESTWHGSVRRKALLSALFGPTDWTTQAAIRALTWIAVHETAYTWEIHGHFLRLESYRQHTGYTCWLKTLYQCWLDLPILHEHEQKDIQGKLRTLEDN